MSSNTSTGEPVEVKYQENDMSLEDVIDDIHFKLVKIEQVLKAVVDGIREAAGEDKQ